MKLGRMLGASHKGLVYPTETERGSKHIIQQKINNKQAAVAAQHIQYLIAI